MSQHSRLLVSQPIAYSTWSGRAHRQARINFPPQYCSEAETRRVYSSLGSFNFRQPLERQCLEELAQLKDKFELAYGFVITVHKVRRGEVGGGPAAERELLERWNVRMVAGCAHHSTNIAPAVVREALRFVLPWLPPAFAAQQRAK